MCFFLIRPWRYLNPQLQNLRVSKWALRRFICIQTNHSAEPSTTDLWYLAASYYPITAIGTTSLLKARTLRLPRFISCGFSSLLQVVVVRRDDVADGGLRRHRLLVDVFVKTFDQTSKATWKNRELRFVFLRKFRLKNLKKKVPSKGPKLNKQRGKRDWVLPRTQLCVF